jgi:dTDP-4-amino-4,6-dideoxygalactose transaminase
MALASCTAALHLSLRVSGIGAGDEVVTTPMTFAATANAVVHAGATPVFADCDRTSMNLTPESFEAAITPRTRAVVPVDFAGRPCAIDRFVAIARPRGITVIEDAAHSLGAEVAGRRVGALADLTCFSFYVTKNLTTAEGGMVTTSDERMARRIESAGLHGLSQGAWRRFSDEGFKHYTVEEPGFKYNMTDLQAALGLVHLARLDQYQTRRRQLWDRYLGELRGLPVDLPEPEAPGTLHARHLFTLLLRLEELSVDRDTVTAALHAENVGVGIHYHALHLHPYYRQALRIRPGTFPNAEWISERTVSIPFGHGLTDDEASDVLRAVRKVLERYRK